MQLHLKAAILWETARNDDHFISVSGLVACEIKHLRDSFKIIKKHFYLTRNHGFITAREYF